MDTGSDWKVIFERELEAALAARASGNEGRARVCARRAAGVIAGEYFARQGTPSSQASAYVNLQRLHDQPGLPEPIRQSAAYLLERISEDHQLPSEADLIFEARRLAAELLKEG